MSHQSSHDNGRGRKPSLRHASVLVTEVQNITCLTCENVTQEGEVYCLYCKMYWDDVRNGLFDEPWEAIPCAGKTID